MKTSELKGPALDWAVAKCEGEDYSPVTTYSGIGQEFPPTCYSTDWSQGGPIIEREGIATSPLPDNSWRAYAPMGTRVLHGREIFDWQHKGAGPTPLIAAMRCFVASKLGDEIYIPEELK